ncbi:hypothetical protein MNBD_ACTINO02-1669, partial [hydrothermal vent metagenome]
MMHGSNFGAFLRHDDSQTPPPIDRALLKRVLAYARPYRRQLVLVLITIFVISSLSLVPPL